MLYCVNFIDDAGEKHTIKAFGVKKISGGLSSVDLSNLKSFPLTLPKNPGVVLRTDQQGKSK